jgi:hypothetical protein
MLLNLFDPTGVCADLEKQQLFRMNGVADAPLMPVIIIESQRNACQIHQRERRIADIRYFEKSDAPDLDALCRVRLL